MNSVAAVPVPRPLLCTTPLRKSLSTFPAVNSLGRPASLSSREYLSGMPGLAARRFFRHCWLPYCLVGIVWVLQHRFVLFIPDWRLVL